MAPHFQNEQVSKRDEVASACIAHVAFRTKRDWLLADVGCADLSFCDWWILGGLEYRGPEWGQCAGTWIGKCL